MVKDNQRVKKVGFAIYGDIHVAGPMFDVHDNGQVYIDGVLQKRHVEEEPEEWEMKDLKFFSMKKYSSEEKQLKLRDIIHYAATKINVNNGREWFCLYAAERYLEDCLGVKLEYVEFFSDIEVMMPDVLKKINPAEVGYKRYKCYSELLRREAEDWFVSNGSLPPINELVYDSRFGCNKEQFKKCSKIIKDLYKRMKGI